MRTNVFLIFSLLLGLIIPQVVVQAGVTLVGSLIDYQTSGAAYAPEASYNAFSNEHMTVWLAGGQLRGRRVNATTGNLLGTEFIVCDDPGNYNASLGDVTYNSNPLHHEWFVVYKLFVSAQLDEDIWGQRFDSNGNPIDGHVVLMSKEGFQQDAHVAHDSTNNRYLVVWKHSLGTNHPKMIQGHLFEADGTPIGSEIAISDGSIWNKWFPKVVYNPVFNEYMVIWGDYRNMPPDWTPEVYGNDNKWMDIYGQRIDINGQLIGSNLPIYVPPNPTTNPNGQDGPDGLTCNTTDGKYLVGITKLTAASGWDTYGMGFDRFGNSENGAFVIYNPTGAEQSGTSAMPQYNPISNTYYITCRDSSSWVMGMEVSAVGLPIAPLASLFTPGVGIRTPVLSIRPIDGQYCSVMNLGNGNVVAQRFTTTPDVIPPGPVTSFAAAGGANATNILTWMNPSDSDYTGAMIRYRTDGVYPVSITDGQLAVDEHGSPNANDGYVHGNLSPSLTYYYSAFAHDGKPNYAGGANAQAQPYAPGDFDFDRDVDQENFGSFQVCLSGDGVLPEAGCEFADLEEDGDVDIIDFGIMEPCMSGANNPPGC
ncbi:MAG: hypothetical protein ACYTBZ_09290 [Planctomycetota bacterium]